MPRVWGIVPTNPTATVVLYSATRLQTVKCQTHSKLKPTATATAEWETQREASGDYGCKTAAAQTGLPSSLQSAQTGMTSLKQIKKKSL